MTFLEHIQSRVLLLDGSMRTSLTAAGLLHAGECAELLNTARPLDVLDIHSGYLDAGADILTANTYAANPINLAQFGLESMAEELIHSGVALCREAIAHRQKKAYVAASIGSTGEQYKSDPRMPQRMYNAFYEQCTYASAAGADLIIIETMGDMAEARLALLAARAASSLPVLVGFSLEPDGRTSAGNPPDVLSLVARKLGAALCGVNCSLLPDALFPAYSQLAESSAIPTFAAPNAGDEAHALTPGDMADAMLPYLHSGAAAIGGCCYTTAEHIRALRALLNDHGGRGRTPRPMGEFICASAKEMPFMELDDDAPIDIRGMDMERAVAEIAAAAKGRASLHIDFANWDGENIRTLLWRLAPHITHTPLAFHVHAARQANAALFAYPGIAALFADADAYKVLKSAARYGAEVIH